MYSSKVVVRASRAARINAPAVRRNVRFASDSAKTGGSSGAVAGGVAGAGAALAVGYLGYWYSGTKSAVDTAKQAKSYMDSAKSHFTVQLQDKTPEVPEAIQALHDMANKYASFVPGGRQYVDKIFKDIEIVREKHGDEVDNIVRELYGELRDIGKNGDLTLATAGSVWEVFSKHSQKLASLAGDAAQDIMNNHPMLQKQLGGSFEQLQQLGDQVGPEAKKQLDDTYKQVSDILSQGVQWNTIDKIRTLIQEKTKDLQKMGEAAFNKGFEQVKPMLEKNPQVKKLIEENMDTLKSGSIKDVVNQVRSAVESGSTGGLEKYINSAKDKVQSSSSSSLSSWLGMIPSGSQIMPQLMKLKEAAEQHGSEAEDIAKATFKDISSVLEKRSSEIEGLVKKAKDNAQK